MCVCVSNEIEKNPMVCRYTIKKKLIIKTIIKQANLRMNFFTVELHVNIHCFGFILNPH